MNRIVSTLAATCAALALAAGVAAPAEARPVAAAWHGGGWHGGGWHGGWHGGGGYWSHGRWWPGAAWGAAIGLGVGLGLGGYYAGNVWYPYPAYSYPAYPVYPAYTVEQPPVVYDTTPRAGTPVPSAQATSPDPVIYPRKGQSAAQQETDHRACNRWAASQQNAMADGSVFQRAVQACMDGRGYSLR